jgi:hypothetical protein
MSATKTNKIEKELVRDAGRTDDPERLEEIAAKLEHQSAYNAAAHVRLKAREIERAYAERVQR